MLAFLYIKATSKEICEDISFPSFFRKMLMSAFFVEILEKNEWLPPVFWGDSNSPYKDQLFSAWP